MYILGIDTNSKNWGINQIYIRCMGVLSMIASAIFGPFDVAFGGANNIIIHTPGVTSSSVTMKYYRTKFGMAGTMDSTKQPIFSSHGCVSGWCYVQYGNEGRKANCSVPYVQENGWIGVGGCFWQEADSFEGSGGFIYARSPSVFQSWGCKSGEISGYQLYSRSGAAPSGDPTCYYEEVELPTRCYSFSCQPGYGNLPQFSGFCVPDSIVYRESNASENSCATNAILGGPILIDEGSGSYVLYETGINLDSYCNYQGCSGIQLVDANGNFRVVDGSNRHNPYSDSFGTVSWDGTAPNCTATITSVKSDGTSTDPKGVWVKTCTYSSD